MLLDEYTFTSETLVLYIKKTASIAHVISENWHENAPKGARKKGKKVPAKLCAEEACLLCHDEEISCKWEQSQASLSYAERS